MTSTSTEVGAAPEAATGVAAGATADEAECVGGMSREAELVHNRQEQRGDKSHNTNDNVGNRCDDDGGGGGCGGLGGARGNEDKTHYQHYHSDNISQHQHTTKRRHHLPKSNRNQHRHEKKEAYQLVPPDGGWAWMVALGTVLIMTLLPMMVTCFSVLFSEYLLSAGSSSTTTAWIFNLQSFLLNGSALLARSLTEEFGWRRVALVSSAMAALGLMMSAFSPSPSFLFFSFSFLTGCGSGVVSCQCFTILPHYFQRRRGIANGIMMSGIGIGQLLGPPVTRFLQNAYGFRGAILIVGAISLNACVGATFFHPFEWHQKKVPLVESQEDVPMISTKAEAGGPTDLTRSLVHSPSEASFLRSTAEEEIESGLVVSETLLESPGGLNVSCPSPSSRYSSTLTLSSFGMDSVAGLAVEDELKKDNHEYEGRRAVLPVRIMRSLIADLRVVKYLRVCILCAGDTLCIIAYINFIMMVPFAMLEAGFSLDTSAWCLSLSSGCNMVTRLLVSALTDWPRLNKRAVYMAGFALTAISISAFTLVSSVDGIMVAMAVHGIGVGMNMGIYNIIIIEVMGVEQLSSVFGTASFCVAIGFLCLGPLIGLMRDVTQNYMVSMHIVAGFAYVALAVWFFMGQAEKIDRRREESKKLRTALQKT